MADRLGMEKAKKQTGNRRPNGQFARGNKLGKRFNPGESGNQQGRPKRTKITEALLSKLSETAPEGEETVAERVAQMLINEALNGNVQAIREIADRTEGRPRQAIDHNNENERERKTRMYGLMVERIIQRMRDEHGEMVSRAEAIEKIAYYQPEITDYVQA
jgi:hypothetical protein